MSLESCLRRVDQNYDPAMQLVWTVAKTPGYHTRIPDGTRIHATRESMDDALAMLRSSNDRHIRRANEIIHKIVSLQVTDPLSAHYGIWGWFAEEPPSQMNPADWNWADFIGVRLAQALILHQQQLQPPTAAAARKALFHASMSIFRRNVGPTYTNIAVMGAVACAAAAELLDRPDLLDYAHARIQSVIDLYHRSGGFAEYNSPTYTRVALEEAERALMLVKAATFRSTAEDLRQIAWRAIAERFHPGTGQMAGPNSRAYSDWLPPKLARYLSEQTGTTIHQRPAEDDTSPTTAAEEINLVQPLPCPQDLRNRFRSLPQDPLEITTCFLADRDGDVVGTTWFTEDACLGSINRDIGWIQRRVLLGYWRTTKDHAVVLRGRMLFNGKDLAASCARQMQRGPRVLSAWSLQYDAGVFHPTLDRVPDSVYSMRDLRFVVSLTGAGIQAKRVANNRFELSAGPWRTVVHTAPSEFMELPIQWSLSQSSTTAQVQAILYSGPERPLDFHQARLKLALAVELLHPSQLPSMSSLAASVETEGKTRWTWQDLEITSPTEPKSFQPQ